MGSKDIKFISLWRRSICKLLAKVETSHQKYPNKSSKKPGIYEAVETAMNVRAW